jgi:hypothetical protein
VHVTASAAAPDIAELQNILREVSRGCLTPSEGKLWDQTAPQHMNAYENANGML